MLILFLTNIWIFSTDNVRDRINRLFLLLASWKATVEY